MAKKKKKKKIKYLKNINGKDSPSKKALSRKDIVSFILKTFVKEYKDIPIQEIKDSLESGIDDKHIKTLESRDSSKNDDVIYYDILFYVTVPNTNEKLGMYIDLEPQGSYSNSYSLIKRAIYYTSRLISRQKSIDFKKQDFNSIKKVYSIWLDIKPNSKNKGCINSYSIKEEHLSGNYAKKEDEYDLINIIFAYIDNKDIDSQYQRLMEFLFMLFIDEDIKPDIKLEKIKRSYDDIIELDEELLNMCNYEQIIEDRAQKKGMAKGMAKGLSKGRAEGITIGQTNLMIDTIINLCNGNNMSLEKALSYFNVDDSIKDKVKQELQKKLN